MKVPVVQDMDLFTKDKIEYTPDGARNAFAR